MSNNNIVPINGQSPFDSIKQTREDGSEFWSARDLAEVLGYSTWQKFENPLDRAIASARNQGHDADRHFNRSVKVIPGGRWGTQRVDDFELTRFAAYLTVMNGDPNMPLVAEGQAYFAVKTREAEVAQPVQELEDARIIQQAIQISYRRTQELEAKVAEDAPKVDYHDTFVADDDKILFRTVASSLDMTEKSLRQLLILKGWIYAEETTRWSNKRQEKVKITRYSEYSHKKLYFYRRLENDAPRFRGEVMWTLKITPAGAAAISRLASKEVSK